MSYPYLAVFKKKKHPLMIKFFFGYLQVVRKQFMLFSISVSLTHLFNSNLLFCIMKKITVFDTDIMTM